MNKFKMFLLIFALVLIVSGCGIHEGLTSNLNNHNTEVVLSSNNYKIVKRVQGTSSGVSVFGFGGSFNAMIADARKEMLENADMVGTSRAIINETVEVNRKVFVVVSIKTITVSGYVIEFIE